MSRARRIELVALLGGVVFAIGLGISGMTQPAKVIAFLDVTGAWDPSLAFVMGGAILVHLYFARRAARGAAPILAEANDLPTKRALDARLFVGAALFGIGWGISGFCPGPALVSVVTLAPTTVAFVAAMIAGMILVGMTWGTADEKTSAAVRADAPL